VAAHSEKVLSLYSGGGGLDIGFRMAIPNARTVCYVERDIASVAVLAQAIKKGYLDDAPIWSDSKTFDGKPWRGKVDWITGGFPCQPWSVAGERKKKEDEKWLWDDIKQIIMSVRPKGLFLENVPGLITGHGIDTILGSLSEMGYDARWGSIKAANVGATHRRERVFILAYSRGFRWRRWGEENNQRLEREWKIQAIQAAGSFSECSSELGIFPPSPDSEQWAEIIREYSELSPALEKSALKSDVCGMANGMATKLHRIDRLRILGNGVVPLQAAYALKTLIGTIND